MTEFCERLYDCIHQCPCEGLDFNTGKEKKGKELRIKKYANVQLPLWQQYLNGVSHIH